MVMSQHGDDTSAIEQFWFGILDTLGIIFNLFYFSGFLISVAVLIILRGVYNRHQKDGFRSGRSSIVFWKVLFGIVAVATFTLSIKVMSTATAILISLIALIIGMIVLFGDYDKQTSGWKKIVTAVIIIVAVFFLGLVVLTIPSGSFLPDGLRAIVDAVSRILESLGDTATAPPST